MQAFPPAVIYIQGGNDTDERKWYMIQPDDKEHVCERCGECCIMGSPTLHLSDLKLFEDNVITLNDVYSIRKGELVYDNVGEELDFLKEEMIKIKELPASKTCIFHDAEGAGCAVYSKRPLQCVYFECWNPRKFLETLSDEKLSREDLFYQSPALREIIATHEERCSYKRIGALFEEVQDGSAEAADEILGVLQFDTDIRPFMVEKLNISQESSALVFGRPLISTIKMFGYSVEKDPDGAYRLVLDEDANKNP